MTLHIYDDIEQGSEQWHAVRRGIVTASVMSQLITPKTIKPAANETSRALTMSLVAERITGYTEPTYQSDDMLRGTLCEPIARDLYSEHYEPVTRVGFMIHEADGFKLGYSPDGLVGDEGLIEIKAPRQKTHLATILGNEVPLEHMAQIQTGLLVSGRDWLDFISYCGGMPLYTHRVFPDTRWFDAIKAAVKAFEKAATEMVEKYLKSTEGLPSTERIDHLADMEI
ncbi:YqaJ viral recombinase family protein [Sinomonas sp. JGH33]|uniref:YqaJ viral recombinase family protein n=1 Tax=Sinomonas terricola TaxID=3110330 RepID=A0ABU5T0T6_9MICC|nr:YqaJ viral recombinase family protein [Sinomonas sp. JGH33]MEA5453263.1 YqaJ viral recombinase family protein [Sinomonas sp. JGH33]